MKNYDKNKNQDKTPFFRWHSRKRKQDTEQDLVPHRRLALQLNCTLDLPDNPRSVLLVTPTASGICGHNSTALAYCMAEELWQPVLLIDVCPTDSEVSSLLNCTDKRGFTDLLYDSSLQLEELVLPTTYKNVSLLAAGTRVDDSLPTTVDNIIALFKVIQSQYGFIVLSGGSVLSNLTALALARYVGCVLLLIVENKTKVEELELAQDILKSCKARKLGLVLSTPD